MELINRVHNYLDRITPVWDGTPPELRKQLVVLNGLLDEAQRHCDSESACVLWAAIEATDDALNGIVY